ncbi:hypothetical protein FLA105534_04823 [Flavobacterium bizetiae]|uniref:Glycosyltransferase 2-like domain-containing protein n=1 Tax=Flavobacterium bizetiae TaxID=2704140 RepID=A0A6J4H1L6_9FLAO|nr:glycosyltransferase [Flavobacterium bizetiae]CAA9203643.1 hypothetical protein FLA105534_04823 [Flavobacterium bizetiae]CAD5344742.1 hypothetical protein FLA105535_04750 [Flavobacterium bizetiae]CAD5350973.1 hypothetical protein FLA105534_04975 [Flavobacterium bizetiae]
MITSLNPKITVLMPVYNCELYIKETIDSILDQTFTDFEFLIIDDASTDKTIDIIKAYNDSRIKLIVKPFNTGYTNSLNHGLKIAKGEYIARMDGDDISIVERFEKQVKLLDENIDVAVCGTLFNIIGTSNTVVVPQNHEDIKLGMLKKCCLGHPTVMIRKSYLEKFALNYDVTKEPAEDYDLWTRLLPMAKLHNLQEVLLSYRVHTSQVSQKRNIQQRDIALEIKVNLLNNLNFEKKNESQDLLRKIILNEEIFSFKEMEQFQYLKNNLLKANLKPFFDKEGFEKYLLDIQYHLFNGYFLRRDRYSPSIYFQYQKIKTEWKSQLLPIDEFKLAVKSLIFYSK